MNEWKQEKGDLPASSASGSGSACQLCRPGQGERGRKTERTWYELALQELDVVAPLPDLLLGRLERAVMVDRLVDGAWRLVLAIHGGRASSS